MLWKYPYKNLLCYCLGKSVDEIKDVAIGLNTAVSLLEYEDGKINVKYLNDIAHLPPELAKGSSLLKR